jgi:hypothetical protein
VPFGTWFSTISNTSGLICKGATSLPVDPINAYIERARPYIPSLYFTSPMNSTIRSACQKLFTPIRKKGVASHGTNPYTPDVLTVMQSLQEEHTMLTATTTRTYGSKEEGCWFDCSRGIYIGQWVIELAKEHGFVTNAEEHVGKWADYEHYHELTDEAEEFMQKFADEGFWFGFSENSGDWGLWSSEERN